jgi:hypothetical protein
MRTSVDDEQPLQRALLFSLAAGEHSLAAIGVE